MKLLKKEMHSLYFNNFIRGIAFALFGIFIPIYLLTIGFSLKAVLVYFLVFQLATFSSILIGYSLARRIGYKPLILFSNIFILAFIIIIYNMEAHASIYIVSILAGIGNALYFIPTHAFFINLSEENKRGRQYSKYAIFGQLSSLFSPLVGAIVVTFLDFHYLFSIVILFVLLSTIPLFYLKNIKPNERITFTKILKLGRENKSFFLGTVVDNIKGEIEGIIWPIFVFLTLQDIMSIGWVGSLITGGTIIFTLIIGKHYDNKSKYFFLKLGAFLYFILWIIRAFVDSPEFIFASSFLAGFFSLMITIPFTSIYYDKAARDSSRDLFIIFREVPVFIGRASFWILTILLIDNFNVDFIIAAIASLIFAFLDFGVNKE